MLRYLTSGESHGQALVATIEGLPAHISVTSEDIRCELARRRLGYGRGARMKFEADEVTILSGIRHGSTLGSPISIVVGNSEWPKWEQVMNPDPVDDDQISSLARNAPLVRPRPGHADLAGMMKYDMDDARPILERASARETAAKVALGAIAKQFLAQSCAITVVSHVVEIGPISAHVTRFPTMADMAIIDEDPLRCFDPDASPLMVEAVKACQADGDTIGGVIEVLAWGAPPGLGSHVQSDRRLDARLASALMGIQAIKGVEIGDGFEMARIRGSVAHDEISYGNSGIERLTQHAGGLEGGMSTGEVIRVKAAMKPIATVPHPLRTIDISTGEPAYAHHQRSDVCAVPAAAVVAESMVALVLAEAVLEKFGGDSLVEVRRNYLAYLASLRERGLSVQL